MLLLAVPAEAEIRANIVLEVLLLISVFPAFAWLPVLFAVPVSAILLSFGWGGWVIAIALGVVFGLGFSALFDIPDSTFVIGGAIAGGLFWLTLRLIRPRAFPR